LRNVIFVSWVDSNNMWQSWSNACGQFYQPYVAKTIGKGSILFHQHLHWNYIQEALVICRFGIWGFDFWLFAVYYLLWWNWLLAGKVGKTGHRFAMGLNNPSYLHTLSHILAITGTLRRYSRHIHHSHKTV